MQYRINMAAAQWREEKANEILPKLQEQFELAFTEGTLLALESGDVAWVDGILGDDEPGD